MVQYMTCIESYYIMVFLWLSCYHRHLWHFQRLNVFIDHHIQPSMILMFFVARASREFRETEIEKFLVLIILSFMPPLSAATRILATFDNPLWMFLASRCIFSKITKNLWYTPYIPRLVANVFIALLSATILIRSLSSTLISVSFTNFPCIFGCLLRVLFFSKIQ